MCLMWVMDKGLWRSLHDLFTLILSVIVILKSVQYAPNSVV